MLGVSPFRRGIRNTVLRSVPVELQFLSTIADSLGRFFNPISVADAIIPRCDADIVGILDIEERVKFQCLGGIFDRK